MRRPGELQVTEYLAERLSLLSKGNYAAEEEFTEATDTDTYIIQPDGKKISIQNVTSEGSVEKNSARNSTAIKLGLPFETEQVDHSGWVNEAISKKVLKNYGNPENIVLAIRGSLPTAPAAQIAELRTVTSPFAGVYYVSIPNTSEDSGYVVALKNLWQTPRIF